ncbi:MAG: LemA family protein [Desulfovibrio sp.]|nr:LemA family protein [Desulfovibrio sp.]MBI4960330.1 LemA family protein [Desulfovibrio sp.]
MVISRSVLACLCSFIVLLISGCGYNVMQQNEENVNRAFGDVQASLQRRADLIPNLVEVVKKYAAHEKDTLTAVTEARAKASSIQLNAQTLSDAQAMANLQKVQGELSSALSRLMVVVEQYPSLKADQSFRDLQHQLEGTENRINVARQRYNEAAQIYNSSLRIFPNSVTNSILLHLTPKEYFRADEASQKAPQVKF